MINNTHNINDTYDLDYYIDLTYNVVKLDRFDDKGIPLVRYPYGIGEQYNPTTCCIYGLGSLQIYLRTGRKSYFNNFLRISDWLIEKSEKTSYGGRAWFYRFRNPWYPVKVPYLSCMSQGIAISVLMRAYKITENKEYLYTAIDSFKVLQRPIEKDGVLVVDKNGTWLEESPSNPPSHILNGFIYALFGIYDILEVGDVAFYNLFNVCVDTLKRFIHEYDNGYWSVYDLLYRYPATLFYHNLHIRQLRALYEISRIRTFLDISKNFSLYRTPLNYYRSIFARNVYNLRNIVILFGFKSLLNRAVYKGLNLLGY